MAGRGGCLGRADALAGGLPPPGLSLLELGAKIPRRRGGGGAF